MDMGQKREISAAVGTVLLFGKSTLLGSAVYKEFQQRGYKLYSPQSHSRGAVADPFTLEEITGYLKKYRPSVVINAEAWTDIDGAEISPDAAYSMNVSFPLTIGRVLLGTDIKFVHFSTAYVFDGQKGSPYTEDDTPLPISVYGQTKSEGERKVLALKLPGTLIVRCAWLFGPGKDTMVSRLIKDARGKESIGVAHNYIGSPGFTPDLAFAVAELVECNADGIYHVTNSGQASLCEFASEVVRLADIPVRITAHTDEDHTTSAGRPVYSVLDCSKYTALTGHTPRSWMQALQTFIYEEKWGNAEFEDAL